MTWFAIFRNIDGELISVGESVAPDQDLNRRGLSKLTLDNKPDLRSTKWDKGTRTFLSVTPVLRSITIQTFIDRLTAVELADIAELALTDRATRGFLEYLRISKSIDPNNPRFRAQLEDLVASGVLASVRVNELLAEE